MHQGENSQSPALGVDRRRQPPEGQTVDDHPRAVGEPGQRRRHPRAGAGVVGGKRARHAVHVDPPALPSQPVDHAAVVNVPPGLLVQRARDDYVQADRAHTGPS